MGSAVIKQKASDSLMRDPIDLDTFKDLTSEYEKLKAVGLTVDEIHKLLNYRLAQAKEAQTKNQGADVQEPDIALEEVRQPRPALPPPKNASLPKKTVDEKERLCRGSVLLVDDSTVAAKVSAKILKDLNFDVVICYAAQEGYDTLKESPDKFCLVLLDIVMPKIDGVELLSWIKDNPDIAHVKVYMLSGLEDQTLAGIMQRTQYHYEYANY